MSLHELDTKLAKSIYSTHQITSNYKINFVNPPHHSLRVFSRSPPLFSRGVSRSREQKEDEAYLFPLLPRRRSPAPTAGASAPVSSRVTQPQSSPSSSSRNSKDIMTGSTLFTCSTGNGLQISRVSTNFFSDVKLSISLYKSPLFLNPFNIYKNKQVTCFTTRGLLEISHSRSQFSFRSECSSVEVGNSPITAEPKFQLDDVIESQQFERDTLDDIFKVALEMESIEKNSSGSKILDGFLMATLFYEPSTRTRLSFESAMKRLGGEVLTTENAREFSSAAKGETLEDTIRTVEGYSDIIVLRHFESGAARRAAATANIPVINAGDGPGQHPTQALLDVYTIGRELGRFDGIKLGLVGDLANGRTVRSLAYLIAKYQDIKIYFVSPDVVKMKDDIKDYLTSKGVDWEESTDLLDVASKCDVIYQTRIQRERFGERIDLYEAARGKYIVDKKVLNVMPKHAIVMHPLPRLDEITLDVDSDPRAAYFRQAKNGLYIRMALLKLLLLGWR